MIAKAAYSTLKIPASFLVGILIFSCATDMNEVDKVTTYERLPAQTLFKSSIQITDSAKVTAQVFAGKIDRYTSDEDPHDEFSNGIKVLSYTSKGEIESTITAKKAINHSESHIMQAMDSVTLENYEGKKLETELLIWNQEENKIFTDQHVKITTKTEILFGEGLDAKDDFSQYEIKNITGRIKIKEAEADSTNIEP